MKRHAMAMMGMALLSTPVAAMKVTNLDSVPHQVAFEQSGSTETESIAPGQTTYFTGMPSGRLSLLSSPHPEKGGPIQSEGMLRHYIGNGRDQGIPADPVDEFAIYPGGDLVLQKRNWQQRRN